MSSSVQAQKQESEEEEAETRKTSLRVDTEVFWAVKHLALDRRKSVAELADEAFRDLLVKYGRKWGGQRLTHK